MVVNKTKKVRKLRGSRTYGWGSPKKHRGAGSRGGRGMAGSGKKGQQKMTSLHLIKRTIGKSGFTRPSKVITKDVAVNLSVIMCNIDKYVKDGAAKKSGSVVDLDVGKLGITKVLGAGSVDMKINVTAKIFSSIAVQKIEKAGGKVIVAE